MNPYEFYESQDIEELRRNLSYDSLNHLNRISARIALVESGFSTPEIINHLEQDINSLWVSNERVQQAVRMGKRQKQLREEREHKDFIDEIQRAYMDIFHGRSENFADDCQFLLETIPLSCLKYALEKGGYA